MPKAERIRDRGTVEHRHAADRLLTLYLSIEVCHVRW